MDQRIYEALQDCPIIAAVRDDAGLEACLMLPDGAYCRKHSAAPFDSQDYFMQQSPHIPAQPAKAPPKLLQRLKQLTERVLRP